ncbi:hypothetical protein N802_05555 [Knoellia sinensis KCTC 19936]|uniref:Sugar ABC transporter substrate-binding protein n=1 Tax=Knoellia sinensis KCTC 19936 TaxID=1385520 RepID=A0A0A0J5G4_9MICO|nr:extracellular solute-binding protein [Knoellia sinensis]KGN30861.1 hypothetical protein N802_05555 [Knoellia sinensis KCTC 19936]
MKMPRNLALTGVLATSLVLTGCGGSGAENDEAAGADGATGEVTMWVYPILTDEAANKKFWADTVQKFKTSNPGIDVTVEVYPWAKRDEALAAAIASNTAPDVVYLVPDQVPVYARSLETIDSMASEDALNDTQDNAKAAATVDGKLVGMPLLTSVTTLVCDKRAFKKAGVSTYPTTWDEYLALGPTFKAQGIDLSLITADASGTLNVSYYPLLWQAGGDVLNDDKTAAAFNEAPGVEALDYFKKMYDGGFINKDYVIKAAPTEQTGVAKGTVACTWGVPTQDLVKLWGAENMEVLPPLNKAESVGYGTVGSLSMLKSTENKEAAMKWIEFATTPENSKPLLTAASFYSPRESAGSLYPAGSVDAALEKLVPEMTVGAVNDKSRAVMGVLTPEIQAAVIGKKTSQQALDDAAKAADALMK